MTDQAARAYVLGFKDVGRTDVRLVGGKGANLGELSRLEGIRVPDGFCVSTEAFKRVMRDAPAFGGLLDGLSRLEAEDRDDIRDLSAEIRRVIEGLAIPEDIDEAINRFVSGLGEQDAYAVRSSATAEDLPTASFAGQQDSYLDVVGTPAILKHVSRCWASLFTERAVSYRTQNGFDHRKVHMAVVVQKMVPAQAAGILFTADPVTSNRKVSSIDAGFGLGEALVAGHVNADGYKVRDGQVIEKTIRSRQVLTDEQILRLERLGRKIEAHFGQPQDIEWCLAADAFSIVQSRPITTLFPIPDAGDGPHVFISVGHQQMMTDPMKPLGLSLWQLTAARPMHVAGGRLFVDVAPELATSGGRNMLINVLGKSDPLIRDALATIVGRGFIALSPPSDAPYAPSLPHLAAPVEIDDDPAIVTELIEGNKASIEELRRNLQAKSGVELLEFILEDMQRFRARSLEPGSMSVIMAGINASWWINEKMQAWLGGGEKNAADTLAQSVPNNVTSEMGLELLDVADAIRPHPEVVEYLQHATDAGFLEGLVPLQGGRAARDAIGIWLRKYGMRCAGEIDVTRPRWSETPTTLVPLLLSNIRNFEPGEGGRKFERGLQESLKKERELLHRLRQLPDGEAKAAETQRMISRLRTFVGYREYPKYGIVSRYFLLRQALLKEAERLVRAGVMREVADIYYLTFAELRDVVSTGRLDEQLVSRRRDEHERNWKLSASRVMTSDGEIVAGAYKRENLPADALVGLAVSAGVVEGRARVLFDMADADLETGDILVTAFTDPSWTPLFVSIKGLVTEVGGLMTHGAVIAREYGLPAVVGVENATRLIQDGQRIRVHGTDGYVEILA